MEDCDFKVVLAKLEEAQEKGLDVSEESMLALSNTAIALARCAFGLSRGNAKLMRKCAHITNMIAGVANQNGKLRQQAKRYDELLLGLYRLNEPTAEVVRARIAHEIPAQLASKGLL